eukprot:6182686-Pleurochrysis_carterae.AAC.2
MKALQYLSRLRPAAQGYFCAVCPSLERQKRVLCQSNVGRGRGVTPSPRDEESVAGRVPCANSAEWRGTAAGLVCARAQLAGLAGSLPFHSAHEAASRMDT